MFLQCHESQCVQYLQWSRSLVSNTFPVPKSFICPIGYSLPPSGTLFSRRWMTGKPTCDQTGSKKQTKRRERVHKDKESSTFSILQFQTVRKNVLERKVFCAITLEHYQRPAINLHCFFFFPLFPFSLLATSLAGPPINLPRPGLLLRLTVRPLRPLIIHPREAIFHRP